MNLYLFTYNNYYNRIVKKEDTLAGYGTPNDSIIGVNFNPNDGIDTTQIVNTYTNSDYVVITYDDGTIYSRWFIVKCKRERNAQYLITLHRDVVADNYDEIIAAPMYIQKATLKPTDPMIYNDEGMTFNRIKKSETFIAQEGSYDKGWIVGYTQIPDASTLTNTTIDYKGNTRYETVSSIEAWDFYDYSTFSATKSSTNKVWHSDSQLFLGGSVGNDDIRITNGEVNFSKVTNMSFLNYWKVNTYEKRQMAKTTAFVALNSTKNLYATWKGINGGELNSVDLELLVGKIIKDATTGRFYKINIKYKNRTEDLGYVNTTAGSLQANLYDNLCADWGKLALPNDQQHNYTMAYYEVYTPAYIYLEETAVVEGDLVMTANDLKLFFTKEHKLRDADYLMFCIPCPPFGSACNCKKLDWATYTGSYTYDKSMAIAQMLVSILQPSSSGGNLIDLQLLPYCPIQSSGDLQTTLPVRDSTDSTTCIGEVFCARSSNFSFNNETSIKVSNPKISNLCDVYRLVSPNYTSSFEFSPAKNGGVSFFHIDCTYKPYTPYINVHPLFSGLYGQDFDDNRGLILAGDYSLPMTNDTFTDYIIQNKNYSNIFDRQMQNLNVTQGWQMAESAVGAVTGTIQGAVMGSMMGPWGAVAGAAVSAIGGAADIAETAATQKENKSYATDLYRYNLGTIDSKPNSLVKSSAFDINYKMWPFIEYSTCTDEERTALENKLTYNGMTVNRIGTISEFLNGTEQFIQGALIRLTGISDDSHMIWTINDELSRGVFIGG